MGLRVLRQMCAVLLLLGLCLPAQSGSSLDQCARIFKRSFFSSCYRWGFCKDNIDRFLDILTAQGVDLSDARVLFVYATHDSHIKPLHPRHGQVSWYYHVILEMDGHVFDFDYGKVPQVLPTHRYFDQMYRGRRVSGAAGPDPLNQILVRAIRMPDYLQIRDNNALILRVFSGEQKPTPSVVSHK